MSFSSKVKAELLGKVHNKRNVVSVFLRDAFISYGMVTDPKKSYHLEFSTQEKEVADDILKYLSKIKDFNIDPKMTKRNENYVVYIKAADSITDFLTYIGAVNSAMEIMQIRMLKDVRNYVNRTTNFETANLDKTLQAAEEHINAIKKIKNTVGLNSLPDNLKEIANLRLENPEMSLKMLGQSLKSPISRSGVNHRLEKIIQISKKSQLNQRNTNEKD